jgi:VIT1/CCC1 family predicted Fe2+/Mn2+ transporter
MKGIRERLSGNERANAMVVGALGLIGTLLLIVAAVFAFQKGVAWPTPTGYALFGIAVFGAAGSVSGGGKVGVAVAVAFGLAGALVLIGHYLGFF